ncbi:MAG: zinc-binding dehydrogenase [Phycisphaerales bacterium]
MNALVITAPDPALAANVAFRTDWPDDAQPPAGHARVRTLCSALNHLDVWVAIGAMGKLPYPRVSGSDACGMVEAVGPGVEPAWVGTKVVLNAVQYAPESPRPFDGPAARFTAHTLLGEQTHGTHRAAFTAPVANLQAVAPDADPAEVAAMGLTFLTAYSMFAKAGIAPGQSVLITGIGGGVALAALKIANYLGCPVAVTSRHQSKLDRAKALGAALCVLDTGADWSGEVRAFTSKRGVDVVIDSVGKATHLSSIKSLCRGGAFVTCGATSGGDATTDLSAVFWRQLRILGSTMGSNSEFAAVVALYRAGAFKPVIDRVFPAAQGLAAFQRLHTAEQFGKIVLDWR